MGEKSKNQSVTISPVGVQWEKAVLVEKVTETKNKVDMATGTDTPQERKRDESTSDATEEVKIDMGENTAVHEEKGLQEEAEVREMVLHNVEHDQDDVPERETEQVEEVKATSSSKVEKQIDSSQDSDTLVEENEDAMLSEDGVLLTYVLKASRKEQGEDKESVNVENNAHCRDSMIVPPTVPDKCVRDINENLPKHDQFGETQRSVVGSNYGTEQW